MVVDALAEVARWYRKQQQSVAPASIDEANATSSTLPCCPSTTINRMLSTPPVRAFLEHKVESVRQALQRDHNNHILHASLALFLELLNGTDPRVLHHMAEAIALAPSEGAYKDHRTRIQFNSTAAQKRAFLASSVAATSTEPWSRTMLPVPVEYPSSLSVDTFMTKYAGAGQPVLIKGGASLVMNASWSLESLVANPVVANTMVDTKRKVADSVRWARLEDGPRQSVGSFIQAMQRDDWSAEPPLGTMYRETWPSLFVGPRGSESATHVDSFGSNFWMALVQGRKRWRLVHPNDMHLLYPTWHAGSADVVYGVDLASTDESKGDSLCPLFRHARVWECVLEAGDILFVPAGTPHFVQNLEHTVAVSSNYIDATNWTQASSALKHQAYSDPRAAELLLHLQHVEAHQLPSGESSAQVLPPPSISFQEFKHPQIHVRSVRVASPPASPAHDHHHTSKRLRSAYADLVADLASSSSSEGDDAVPY
ncbi:hypothetical protein AaE_005026 [Aphanomyces astaci]|uniref:JmjC domain-containing protein n=1 Tax=Aphanomyces astaci TaxID=112090 RepID=A0A6A5API2_APHAT|nr:hypothetical protein AaE_005026 [Aphanomyces astaci]